MEASDRSRVIEKCGGWHIDVLLTNIGVSLDLQVILKGSSGRIRERLISY